ncbi:hypothetical protein [Phycicoccus jejuensis]|uniref:hypothetical protein n=1 Tax=Phycicoccus jejuensis TaxID=367299 RepID=UPI0004C358EA|nr:hypothetical protein [Phycicoccus jejuensis]
MADVAVDAEVDADGRTVACAKISSGEWEVNVRATPLEFASLDSIRSAAWASRNSVAVGRSAGAPVFWSCDGSIVSILIGSDDETWDVALSAPIDVVDRVVQLVAAL